MTPARRTSRRRTRAVDERARHDRRSALLRSAARLFDRRAYENVAIADIARGARLAKGTVYLYFDTKEALFLELVSEQLFDWSRYLAEELRRKAGGSGDRRAATVVAATLAERPQLVRLLALLHVVLERNADAALLLRVKRRFLEALAEPAQLLEEALDLEAGAGVRLLLWMHALIVGLAQMSEPSATLSKVLDQDAALHVFRRDFRVELEAALVALFSGIREVGGLA